MAELTQYTLSVRRDDDGMLWGEVKELPGCLVSGEDMDELAEAAEEAIVLYLQDDDNHIHMVEDEDPAPSNVVPMRAARRESTPSPHRPVPTALLLEG